MSASQNKGYYLELNESVLLAARTASLGHPPVIEDFREITLDNKATIAQAMGIDLIHIEHSPSGRPFTVADKVEF